ncbi:MAG: VCBS repeat-containing protein [Pseudomonadota bacterium]
MPDQGHRSPRRPDRDHAGAPDLSVRPKQRAAAIAGLALLLATGAEACDYPAGPPDAGAAHHAGPGIVWAAYSDQTTRYAHGVLGDAVEAGTLRARTVSRDGETTGPCETAFTLPRHRVFEDITPRLADVTGDGLSDAIVIESDIAKGAQLAIYGLRDGALAKIAATPFIGRANRWLAPAGIADFDGDGVLDVAYVETPHIGGTLRLWSFAGGEAREIAARPGYSNHRIGENWISGGLRDCGDGAEGGPEIVLANASWSGTHIARLGGNGIEDIIFATNARPETLEAALACQPTAR